MQTQIPWDCIYLPIQNYVKVAYFCVLILPRMQIGEWGWEWYYFHSALLSNLKPPCTCSWLQNTYICIQWLSQNYTSQMRSYVWSMTHLCSSKCLSWCIVARGKATFQLKLQFSIPKVFSCCVLQGFFSIWYPHYRLYIFNCISVLNLTKGAIIFSTSKDN